MLLVVSTALGGWRGFDIDAVTPGSWLGFTYLVLVASLAGFTAYVYLLTHTTAARASTYAFVNPVVAVAAPNKAAARPILAWALLSCSSSSA